MPRSTARRTWKRPEGAETIEALKMPKEVSSKVLKDVSSTFNQLACITHSNFQNHLYASLAKRLKLLSPKMKGKAQTKPQVTGTAPTQGPEGADAPWKAQG